MRVLVTGSTGLIGRALMAHLESSGHEPIGLSRGVPIQGPHVSADIGAPGLPGELARRQPRCDAIVHAAAAIRTDGPGTELALTNCFGTQQVIDLAFRWEVDSFVFLSSAPVVGRPIRLPITEDHPIAPRTAYHASKLFGEHLVAIAEGRGMDAVSLRITAPVGRGMPGTRLLSVFVQRALSGEPLKVAGDGSRAQDYVDVRDVAAAAAACVERRARGLMNVASGQAISNIDLARRCIEVLGSSSDVQHLTLPDPDDGVRWEVSIERAAARIGYAPRRSLAESISWVAEDLQVSARA